MIYRKIILLFEAVSIERLSLMVKEAEGRRHLPSEYPIEHRDRVLWQQSPVPDHLLDGYRERKRVVAVSSVVFLKRP